MSAMVTTMDALHDAIVADLRAAAETWEGTFQVGAYEPWDEFTEQGVSLVQTPALLLQVEGFEVSDEPDPCGRLALLCTLAVHVVLSQATERLQQTLPQLAARIAARIRPPGTIDATLRGAHWGLGFAVENPTRVQAQPGEFRPGLNGRDSWLVRWEQTVYLADQA